REPAPRARKSVVRYYVAGPVAIVVTSTFALGMAGLFLGLGLYAPATGESYAWVPTMMVGALAFIVPGLIVVQHARVEVDPGARSLLLARVRWPLRAEVRTIPLSRVRDAIVLTDSDDAILHMVALEVDGEPPIPLIEGLWVSGEKRHEETAAAIRALLDKPGDAAR